MFITSISIITLFLKATVYIDPQTVHIQKLLQKMLCWLLSKAKAKHDHPCPLHCLCTLHIIVLYCPAVITHYCHTWLADMAEDLRKSL